MANRSDMLLVVRGLSAGYGPITVVRDANLDIRGGEVVGLLGRNGAGKTTVISAICGMIEKATGQICLEGVDICHSPADKRVNAGIAVVPSGGRLFKSLTVTENLTIGLKKPSPRDLDQVFELFPELAKLRDRYAGKLSGGERQMVAIGRATLLRPKLLLLDEPTEGLAPVIVLRLIEALRKLWQLGVATLIAEQNTSFTDSVCRRHYLIEKGLVQEVSASRGTSPARD